MRILLSSLTLLAVLTLGGDGPPGVGKAPAPKKDGQPLQAGKPLPAAFQPYNVTGANKHHFHCIISARDLDPMVLIFYKNVAVGDAPLQDLLKRLDAAMEKHAAARLGCFIVFLPDELPDVTGSSDDNDDNNNNNDDARIELEKKLEAAAADMKLKHVVLCLDNKSDVEKFGLSDANLITVVLYDKLKVVAVHALPKSDFAAAAIDKIMADAAKLCGKRK